MIFHVPRGVRGVVCYFGPGGGCVPVEELYMPTNIEETIKDLEQQIEWLREHAEGKLDEVEKANPGLSEAELWNLFHAEAERALDGINPAMVAANLQRAFLELRRKRSGYNRDHIGGA